MIHPAGHSLPAQGRPLAKELRAGRIRRALVCHIQDRWYLGELFCHATWIGCLARAGATVSVCTNRHYLELFENHPTVVARHPPEDLTEELIAGHDLVVFTATHPPTAMRSDVPLALYSWNGGKALARHGIVDWEQRSDDTNLFEATCHRHGETALPDGEYLTLHPTDEERATAAVMLRQVLRGREMPVTVVNPSASNARTRDSTRPKAVSNLLDTADYEVLIEQLLLEFPDDLLVVGAPIKPGDRVNHALIATLGERFANEPRVASLAPQIVSEQGLSLRTFGALLSLTPVRQMVGNSTGSNAHLAATLNVLSLSIERGVDEEVRANWRDRGRGQMGSFRWRNPHPRTVAFALPWQERSSENLGAAARLIKRHAEFLAQDRAGRRERARAETAARVLAGTARDARTPLSSWQRDVRALAKLLDPDDSRALYFDFRDEAEYLRATGAQRPALFMEFLVRLGAVPEADVAILDLELGRAERDLFASLVRSSNLVKLAALTVAQDARS